MIPDHATAEPSSGIRSCSERRDDAATGSTPPTDRRRPTSSVVE
ncbi:hypothetical protein [Haloplanus rubicundus]|nr:hypothetical protein [Haloplanus rubicundus]